MKNNYQQTSPARNRFDEDRPTISDTDSPRLADRLHDAFLARGYPCMRELAGGRPAIRFCDGWLPADKHAVLRTVQRGRLRVRAQPVQRGEPALHLLRPDRTLMRRVPATPDVVEAICREIVRAPARICRETGPDTLSRSAASLKGFLGNAYGAKVPVSILEPGIALLVKVLPWYGVRTSMSCAGHPLDHRHPSPPTLWFFGHHHTRWCAHLFENLFADLPIARTWTFDPGPLKGSWASGTFRAYTLDPRDGAPAARARHAAVLADLATIARRLIDPALVQRFRAEKAPWATRLFIPNS